jgi:hypothetical protein
MGHRAADEAKVDALGRVEPNRLERRGHTPRDLGEVLGEHHVGGSLPHPQLVLQGARRPSEIRTSDHVEDRFAGRGDLPAHRAERARPSTNAGVDRHGPTRDQAIGLPRAESEQHALEQVPAPQPQRTFLAGACTTPASRSSPSSGPDVRFTAVRRRPSQEELTPAHDFLNRLGDTRRDQGWSIIGLLPFAISCDPDGVQGRRTGTRDVMGRTVSDHP